MNLYHTTKGILIEAEDWYLLEENWDEFVNRDFLHDACRILLPMLSPTDQAEELLKHLLPPVGSQEIWASGVTYFRSREARMEEAKDAGGGDFYDRVYSAERPELFFKSPAYRAVGHGGKVRIRRDSQWNVPEPELTLMISSGGQIIGYTIGNDMSSRDIEGENPLYLPQAKSYDGSAAIGPCLHVPADPLPADTSIHLQIHRKGQRMFEGETSLQQLKRDPEELVSYLFREMSFPNGCLLMTGTGIVPPDSFTLDHDDEIHIRIDPIGTLTNTVE